LKEGRTHTIGLVIPPAGRRLTAAQLGFVAGMVDAAAQANLDVLLSPSGGDHERSFERVITGGRVDGVVVMEVRLNDARVARLQRTRLPFVTIGRTAQPDDISSVDIDYGLLTARCVHHLADLGHRNIVLINRSAELVAAGYGPARRALAAFNDATAQRGIAGAELCCADDRTAGQACLEQILAARPKVTAVVTINEAALDGVRRALERSELIVPRDFSIAGIGQRSWAESFEPALTGADVPADEMCARAIELLVERINAPDRPPRHVLLAPPICLRGSTGPVPAGRRARSRVR
jgi:DNA-binding LacI/PurR family transcriptional regulator